MEGDGCVGQAVAKIKEASEQTGVSFKWVSGALQGRYAAVFAQSN